MKKKFIKIYEEYVESPEYRIDSLFTELTKNIKYWFDKGSFSTQGLTLYDIKTSRAYGQAEKNLIFDFSDNKYYFQVIIILKLEDVQKMNKIDNFFMKIKKYDMDQTSLIRTWSDNIKVTDLTENFIIQKISEIEDKTDTGDNASELSDKNADLTDNIS